MSQSLSAILAQLGMNSRFWQILEVRVNRALTLEETGQLIGGITRERVRQLEAKIIHNFDKNMGLVAPLLNVLEASFKGSSHSRAKRAKQNDNLDNTERLIDEATVTLQANA